MMDGPAMIHVDHHRVVFILPVNVVVNVYAVAAPIAATAATAATAAATAATATTITTAGTAVLRAIRTSPRPRGVGFEPIIRRRVRRSSCRRHMGLTVHARFRAIVPCIIPLVSVPPFLNGCGP